MYKIFYFLDWTSIYSNTKRKLWLKSFLDRRGVEKDICKSIVAKTSVVQTWTGLDYYYYYYLSTYQVENLKSRMAKCQEIVISTE